MSQLYLSEHKLPGVSFPASGNAPRQFHVSIPGFKPTPLRSAPGLAKRLGVSQIWIKDESQRLGLPSFKILGASWAAYRCLLDRFGASMEQIRTFGQLAGLVGKQNSPAFCTATDGNHGRAVAWIARMLGREAFVFMPQGSASARVKAIEAEGAVVTLVRTYDDAVKEAGRRAGNGGMVLQDAGYPGYERVPEWIVEGYSTMLHEVDERLKREGRYPSHVFVQIGVGSLADAVLRHFRSGAVVPTIVGVEPTKAACAMESAKAGRIVSLPGHQDSIMAGLNCGTPSSVSFPRLQAGIDCFAAIEDERAMEAMKMLAEESITAGETGAAGLGGLLEILDSGNQNIRSKLGLDKSSRILLMNTEGATDPDLFKQIVGRKPHS